MLLLYDELRVITSYGITSTNPNGEILRDCGYLLVSTIGSMSIAFNSEISSPLSIRTLFKSNLEIVKEKCHQDKLFGSAFISQQDSNFSE